MAAVGSRLIKLELDGDEFSAELTNARLAPADADQDTVTFAEALAGGKKDWHLQGTALQDPGDADSLWNKVFDHSGETITYTYIPYGNATPSATEPHFTGSIVIGAPDGDFLGGDADSSTTKRQTFDIDWICTDKPTRVTSTP